MTQTFLMFLSWTIALTSLGVSVVMAMCRCVNDEVELLWLFERVLRDESPCSIAQMFPDIAKFDGRRGSLYLVDQVGWREMPAEQWQNMSGVDRGDALVRAARFYRNIHL